MPSVDPVANAGLLRMIHDEYRTALLNKKYYAARLDRYKTINRYSEIAIALGATTGTSIAGLAIFKQGYGTAAWAVISGISMVLSVIKPIMNLPKEVERYSKLTGEYASMFGTLRIIEQDISASQSLTSEQIEVFNQVRKRTVDLLTLDDTNPNRRLLEKLQDEVNKEIPPSILWMPMPPLTSGETHGDRL